MNVSNMLNCLSLKRLEQERERHTHTHGKKDILSVCENDEQMEREKDGIIRHTWQR